MMRRPCLADRRAHSGHDLYRHLRHIMGHARMHCSVRQNLLLCISLRNKATIHANISTPKYFRHERLPSRMVCAVTYTEYRASDETTVHTLTRQLHTVTVHAGQ